MTSKSNSKAGATLLQIKANATSIVVMQQKRCPNFDVFDAVFGSSPSIQPVHPTEVGAGGESDSPEPEFEVPEVENEDPSAPYDAPSLEDDTAAPAAVSARAAPAAPAAPKPAPAPVQHRIVAPAASAAPAAAAGKPAAAFHLAPSKKEKKNGSRRGVFESAANAHRVTGGIGTRQNSLRPDH
jgi:hypothetical protein